MNRLERRVEALEQETGNKAPAFLWVEPSESGEGFIHEGVFYSDNEAVCNGLGLNPDNVVLFRWATEGVSA